MKKEINVFEYAGHILSSVQKGVLLTAKAGGRVNSMTIAWGTLGIEWGKPIFTAFVRESRFTKSLLDQNPEFTINVPYGEYDKSILSVCGTKSGRDMDKAVALGLTLVAGEKVQVPGIRQLPLTLECRIIYRQDQDPSAISREDTQRYYPPLASTGKPDYHTAYYGEILSAYILGD